MCSKCENCELFLLIEQERTQWYKELSLKNINLYKKLSEQQDLITILKKKLLEKRNYFMSEYVTELIEQKNIFSENFSNALVKTNFEKKVQEVNEFLEIFNYERESFQKELEENEKFYSENISYLNGLVDYFRESVFEELDKSNKLKQYFIQKMSGLAASNHHIILNTLKDEGERLNLELKLRYRKTIQKSKQEIERQNLLVSKLRKHNKQLYSLMQKTKVGNEDKIASLEKNVQDLKSTIRKLKERNDNLHTQIKLQVVGCQKDIYDARKRMKTLIKTSH
jgi:hypothetical protein